MSNITANSSNFLNKLSEKLKEPASLNRIALSLGFNGAENDPRAREQAEMYMYGVFTSISQADAKTNLQKCTYDSIIKSAISAAKQKVSIDGRGHANLIAFFNKDKGSYEASFQINAKGYEYKLHEHLASCNVRTICVFDGDEFDYSSSNGFDSYNYVGKNAFNQNENNLVGIAVVISWTEGEEKRQVVELLQKNEILNIKKSAPQSFVWNRWFIERAKTAAIKRACKRFFNKVQGLEDLVKHDNELHDLKKLELEEHSENNLIENLNQRVLEQKPTKTEEVVIVENEVKTEEPTEDYII